MTKTLKYRNKKTMKNTSFLCNIKQYNSNLIYLAIIRSECVLPTLAVKPTLKIFNIYLKIARRCQSDFFISI